MEEVKFNDAIRQKDLEELGLTILRFTTDEVSNKMEYILQKIEESIK